MARAGDLVSKGRATLGSRNVVERPCQWVVVAALLSNGLSERPHGE